LKIELQPIVGHHASLPPRWRKGRGWWCARGGEELPLVGAGALGRHTFQLGGHTTTQPSSIEEEG
jgi:hypothetical protein